MGSKGFLHCRFSGASFVKMVTVIAPAALVCHLGYNYVDARSKAEESHRELLLREELQRDNCLQKLAHYKKKLESGTPAYIECRYLITRYENRIEELDARLSRDRETAK